MAEMTDPFAALLQSHDHAESQLQQLDDMAVCQSHSKTQ